MRRAVYLPFVVAMGVGVSITVLILRWFDETSHTGLIAPPTDRVLRSAVPGPLPREPNPETPASSPIEPEPAAPPVSNLGETEEEREVRLARFAKVLAHLKALQRETTGRAETFDTYAHLVAQLEILAPYYLMPDERRNLGHIRPGFGFQNLFWGYGLHPDCGSGWCELLETLCDAGAGLGEPVPPGLGPEHAERIRETIYRYQAAAEEVVMRVDREFGIQPTSDFGDPDLLLRAAWDRRMELYEPLYWDILDEFSGVLPAPVYERLTVLLSLLQLP